MSQFLYLSLLLIVSTPLFAAEPIEAPELVVSGKRLRGDHRSARVWTESDLERESGRTVGDILRESAGVDFTNGTSGNSNLQIRGASASQTLVIIDGVKANDPSATNRYFDWSRIDAREIERVEVLKGPQAVSYGSDAIGGVVLITTKRPEKATASLEGGSESFARARAAVGTRLGQALGGVHTLGLEALGKGRFDAGSAALSPVGSPVEGDPSREASGDLVLRSKWDSNLRSSLSLNLRTSREEIDAGAYQDALNSSARNREVRASGTVDGKLENGMEWGVLASHLDFRRSYLSPSETLLRGTNSRAEFHLRSSADSQLEWTAGVEATREALLGDSPSGHAETIALFAESVIPLTEEKTVLLDLGGRLSKFSNLGSQLNEKGGVTVRPWDDLEFDLGVSTGFKAPSLYSLYDPTYGNPRLKPEESTQLELGSTYRGDRGEVVSLRGFTSWIRNRFGYDPVSFRSLNIERAEIRGVELEVESRIVSGLRLAPALTYLSTKDFQTGLPLADVPRWKGTLKVLADFSRSTSATLSLVGSTRGVGFYRTDLTARHRHSEAWTSFARIENLLDRDYSEVRGYRSPGFSGFLGVEWSAL